jgi:hypothetical protein
MVTAAIFVAGGGFVSAAQAQTVAGPPSSVGFFPLDQVKRGMRGTAWTVFEGTVPEPMEVEILGLLHGARGPGRDLILAKLHGEKAEFTGVVAGMSGSPVYLDGKLLGALSYRIGQFTKEPIAGITPIGQMLEVRDLPLEAAVDSSLNSSLGSKDQLSPSFENARRMGHPDLLPVSLRSSLPVLAGDGAQTFAAMETPLTMSGFAPEAIRLWKERMAGTGLDAVSAGGASGSGGEADDFGPVVPGSAVSLQMVRGDMEIAATCTVTYIDPKQLLACGHPVLQAGPVSIPMTSAEVLTTLASPLNSFKIINTGKTIGAFTQDRDAAIRGEFGAKARMIPVSMTVTDPGGDAAKTVTRRIEVLDLPSMTASAMLVSVYQVMLETNQSTASTSYHITGEITVHGRAPVPVDSWGVPNDQMVPQLAAALGLYENFNRLYANATRVAPMESVQLHIESFPEDRRVELESVRLVSSSIVHAGDTVMVEATLRPWRQAARNVRVPFVVPARLQAGTLRLLVSSSLAIDRTMDAARSATRPASVAAASARLRSLHAADRLYVCLLLPESQASLEGSTLVGLPLSMANTMESERSGQEVGLHGESLVVAADVPAGGVLTGQQLLTVRVEAGGGLH